MNELDSLAQSFEKDRRRLRAVAYRLLGSRAEADDALQEAWLRISTSDFGAVENMSGWLTTVVARVSLNMIKSRASRREELTGEAPDRDEEAAGPEGETILADSVGVALLVILDTLTPAERLAFVLHDLFAVPFEEIAPIVDRSPAAARQLASRARRRVQRAGAGRPASDAGKEGLVRAFLAASREGDFDALLSMLAPGIVLRGDPAAVAMGAEPEVRGAEAVARTFARGAKAARPAVIDDSFGLVWAPAGRPRVAFRFTTENGKITAIDLQADLIEADVVMLRNQVR